MVVKDILLAKIAHIIGSKAPCISWRLELNERGIQWLFAAVILICILLFILVYVIARQTPLTTVKIMLVNCKTLLNEIIYI